VTLFFFDFDKTLYAYNFRKRLPELSRLTGVSQYQLAKTWWAAGYEKRAESGEWRDPADYFAEFERVTGAHLTLEDYQASRHLASTPIPGSVDALRHAATLGTVSLLSNNPSPFAASLPVLAPDVCAIVGENRLVSCDLGVRKPDPRAYQRALERFGVTAEETFFADDSAENIAGAQSIGITGHHLTYVNGMPQVQALRDAIDAFAGVHA
jgi:HAD superfamily hydrolase (TIGR01509 family)